MDSGAGGFVQREMKGQYQRADRAQALPAASAPAMERFAAGGRGANGAAGGAPGGGIHFADEAVKEAKKAEETVKQIGNRTFFRRDGQWVDSQVTKEQEAKARRVKQFSDEYFELARAARPHAVAVPGLRRARAADARQPGVVDRTVSVRCRPATVRRVGR